MEVKMIMQVSFKKYDWIDQNLIKVECLNSLSNLLFTLLYQVGLLLTMDSWFSQNATPVYTLLSFWTPTTTMLPSNAMDD